MNKLSHRPLSPHLQIYRVQLTSFMSIVHRITGIGLCVALHGWILWLWSLGFCPPVYCWIQEAVQYKSIKIGIGLCLWSLTYHAWNGVRHMMWDLGYGLGLNSVYITGYVVWGLSLGSTLALWFWL